MDAQRNGLQKSSKTNSNAERSPNVPSVWNVNFALRKTAIRVSTRVPISLPIQRSKRNSSGRRRSSSGKNMNPDSLKNPRGVARVAVIGAGHWGKHLIRNFRELSSLAAICDICPERQSGMAKDYGSHLIVDSIDRILHNPQIDAVAIATPSESHGYLAQQAILAGKDVFVEKPLCLSLQEGRVLVDLARRRQRILMVGHLLWYHPAVLKLQHLIEKGELGQIKCIYSNRLNLGKIRREENILWSFAPHDVSVILGLLNEMPNHVHCEGGNYITEHVADVTISRLSFPSGIDGHIFVSWLHPFKEQKLVVVGAKAMAVFNDVEETGKLKIFPHSVDLQGLVPVANMAPAKVIPIESVEPLRSECVHFLNCIRTRATPRTDGEEGLRVLSVLQQCQDALARPTVSAPSSSACASDKTVDYFAHDSAFIDEDVEIGNGTKIWHVSHIMSGSRLGDHCNIGQNVTIGPRVKIGNGVKIQNNVSVYEGVTLEDHVFCGPSATFTNVLFPRSEIPRMDELRPTLVKQGATLGANCTIVCGCTVGRYACVGAGAVVTKNVPDHALVYGNPARIHGWVCRCGEKLNLSHAQPCGACGWIPAGLGDRQEIDT
jgi:UDP-2-acetamido-3-amino-2,3-dideoxy-glucuronate N-acetyltransferase